MKIPLSIAAFLMLSATVFGQADSPCVRKYRHEFGVDMVKVLRLFTSKGGAQYVPTPAYYMTYRLKFRHSGLRAAVGGSYSNGNDDDFGYMVAVKLKNIEKQLNLRLGWEFSSMVAQKLEAYYGLDLMGNYSNHRRDSWGTNGGYFNGKRYKYVKRGAAAFLGIRYAANKRVNFSSDLGVAYYLQKETSTATYIPVNNMYPAKADEPKPAHVKIFGEFRPPLMLSFNLAF